MNWPRLVKMLEQDEGFKPKPYRCSAGKLTIGYGRNLEDKGLSREEASYLLHEDIRDAIKFLDQQLPWWKSLDGEARQEALVNMAFNLGGRLLGFKKMLAALKSKDYGRAADEALDSKWAGQVGQRAQRIARAFREGVW